MKLNFKLKKNHIELLKDMEEEMKQTEEIKNKNNFKKMLYFHKKINSNLTNKYNKKLNMWDLDNIVQLDKEIENNEDKEIIQKIKKIIERKNKIIIHEIINTDKWKEYIIQKFNQIVQNNNININEDNKKTLYNDLSKLIVKNILEYKYSWNCCNKIVILNNVINKIKMININDMELKDKIEKDFFNNYLKNIY